MQSANHQRNTNPAGRVASRHPDHTQQTSILASYPEAEATTNEGQGEPIRMRVGRVIHARVQPYG
ncbi:hypothetical protein IMZ48_13465 [Candidatus Bathyarchaeota archaeon]|nr:hypothetical protein [Candidatus Bathyarchaeota archaeon]